MYMYLQMTRRMCGYYLAVPRGPKNGGKKGWERTRYDPSIGSGGQKEASGLSVALKRREEGERGKERQWKEGEGTGGEYVLWSLAYTETQLRTLGLAVTTKYQHTVTGFPVSTEGALTATLLILMTRTVWATPKHCSQKQIETETEASSLPSHQAHCLWGGRDKGRLY